MTHTKFGKDWTVLEEVIGDLARALPERLTFKQTYIQHYTLSCAADATQLRKIPENTIKNYLFFGVLAHMSVGPIRGLNSPILRDNNLEYCDTRTF